MRFLLPNVLMILLVASRAAGTEPAEAQARATLALAKAKRDREAAACFTDYDAAAAEARRVNKPLVLWVGVKCSAHPSVRAALADAIHCHLPATGRDPTLRVVFQGADGLDRSIRASDIGPDTARQIRETWRKPSMRFSEVCPRPQ
jgi:hypothetical protein